MKKRLLGILLTLVMALTLVPFGAVTASAATSGKCGDNLTWKLDSAGTLTISGTGKMYDYEYNPGAPWMGTDVKNAVIQSGVTYIGQFAFSGCASLASVAMADTVTEIGNHAFYQAHNLTDTTFPNGLVKIGDHSFENSGLTRIDLPVGLKTIGRMAFAYCAATAVTIPNTVASLDHTFTGCSNLISVSIPIGVTSLEGTFYSCSSLKSVTLPDTLTNLGDFTFVSCTSLQSIQVPASVKTVGKNAFTNCTALKNVYFNGNAPAFGEDPFLYTTTTAYYPQGNTTWTTDVLQDYGGTVTWKPFAPTVITCQPKSVVQAVGTTAVFEVTATGSGLKYQWYYRTSADGTWTKSTLTGAATATLSVKALESRNGYQYRCKVSGDAGYVYSSAATLTVSVKPVITTQPKSKTSYVDTTVKFTVKADNATSYQWYYRTPADGTWKKSTLTGATTATLSVKATAARDGYQYKCKVSNDAGHVYSKAATLTVSVKPVITTQPKSKTASVGDTVKFTVKADGATSYQWYYRTSSSGSWAKCSGTGYNTATLTVTAKAYRDGYQYRCKVSNDAGSVTSKAATLTVANGGKPTITTQPVSKTAYEDDIVKFKVVASGTELTYQWYYRTSSSGSWAKCSGTGYNTATLTVTAKAYRDGYQYRCLVKNNSGQVYSSAATLTVI